MGNNDEGKSSKSDKSSSPVPTAYYGPRVTMQPYYNSAVASGHAHPPYMWGPPQPMMQPYGAPYATIYSYGGVYAHPAVPVAATPVETPTKSSGNTEQGLMKKLKGFDGLAMSIGNGTAENAEGGAEPRLSQSAETEASTDGSDGNTAGMDQTRRKRRSEGTPTVGGDGKNEAKSNNTVAVGDGIVTVSPKANGTVLSSGMTTALELTNPTYVNAKSSPTSIPCGVMSSEVWLQNERELKRERRKQSNRESARRSRLRKQAETGELARKVESLTAENITLRSEINQLTEKSEKLRLENAALVEGLKNAQLGHAREMMNNARENEDKDGETYEKNANSGSKLHQLLDMSSRADAVAAS
ncbi:hypothetical protein PTKIN_Ptkin15bG0049700 [Pterospermum kingtungense]